MIIFRYVYSLNGMNFLWVENCYLNLVLVMVDVLIERFYSVL